MMTMKKTNYPQKICGTVDKSGIFHSRISCAPQAPGAGLRPAGLPRKAMSPARLRPAEARGRSRVRDRLIAGAEVKDRLAILLVDDTGLHHERDLAHQLDIVERIARHRHHVGI